MRTFLYILIMLVFLSVNIAAQNPTRKVLCTLAPNEVIMYDEHLIQCKLNEYRFAFCGDGYADVQVCVRVQR